MANLPLCCWFFTDFFFRTLLLTVGFHQFKPDSANINGETVQVLTEPPITVDMRFCQKMKPCPLFLRHCLPKETRFEAIPHVETQKYHIVGSAVRCVCVYIYSFIITYVYHVFLFVCKYIFIITIMYIYIYVNKVL